MQTETEKRPLIEQINPVIAGYIRKRHAEGKDTFILCGGRRSGKTFAIMQFLLGRGTKGEVINVASMTAEQGRLGAYADACTIIRDSKTLSAWYEIMSSPRELRATQGGGKLVFNSYQNPETAKGIACDWLFINEANNFSKQQYTDLLANVRRGVFLDYNPNKEFWVKEYFSEEDVLKTTWKQNPYLTPLQKEYFEDLRRKAEAPSASAVDIRNYNVYYLGEYSELRGNIFYKQNFRYLEETPSGLRNFTVFCDPSALRGADFFACCVTAEDEGRNVYLLDTYSIDCGTPEMIHKKLKQWLGTYDRLRIYIETNGVIGLNFYNEAVSQGIPCHPWCSRENKFERIVANFHNFQNKLFLVRHALLDEFMIQIFDFSENCAHDDNADALNSSFDLHYKYKV